MCLLQENWRIIVGVIVERLLASGSWTNFAMDNELSDISMLYISVKDKCVDLSIAAEIIRYPVVHQVR